MTTHAQATRALDALRKADAGRTPGEWVAASDNRRKDGIALVGLAALRGQGGRGCIAVLAGSGDAVKARHANAHHIATTANAWPAVLDLIEATIADPTESGAVACGPKTRYRLALRVLLGADYDEGNES